MYKPPHTQTHVNVMYMYRSIINNCIPSTSSKRDIYMMIRHVVYLILHEHVVYLTCTMFMCIHVHIQCTYMYTYNVH